MIEFDDYGNRLTDADALEKKIQNRLTMVKGEVPYLSMGIWKSLFTFDDITPVILDALSDLGLNGIQMDTDQSRIKVGTLVVNVKEVLSKLTEE